MQPDPRLDRDVLSDVSQTLDSPPLQVGPREHPSPPQHPTQLRTNPYDNGPASPMGLCAASPWQRFVKRGLDVAGSVTGLVVLLPVLLATAIAVKASSPGPAFYVSRRVGRDGRPFRMVKFRSMYHGAHHVRLHHDHLNMHESGPIFKIREDPRTTPIGRFIRRCSVDELPQLWHVLCGEMSLVGPRPPLPEEFHSYGPREQRRLDVKPGITCIWQVSGRSDLDFQTWVDMDLAYIDSWSLRLDARLLSRTIGAVVSRRGAY